jgi:hypothetical protein
MDMYEFHVHYCLCDLMCPPGSGPHPDPRRFVRSRHVISAGSCPDGILLCGKPWMIGPSGRVLKGQWKASEISGMEPSKWMLLTGQGTYHRPNFAGAFLMKSCHGWADHMIEPWQGVTDTQERKPLKSLAGWRPGNADWYPENPEMLVW